MSRQSTFRARFLLRILAVLLLTGVSWAAEPPVCEWVFGGGGAEHDKTRAVAVDEAGNVFLASECVGDAAFGKRTWSSAGGMDMVLVKLDPAGEAVWVSGLGGSKTDRAYGADTDAAGNIYVTGHFESADLEVNGETLENAGDYDVFTAKFSPAGKILWVRTAGGEGYDYGHGLVVDGSGDVIITGAIQGESKFGEVKIAGEEKGRAIFCAKYGPEGDLKWVRTTSGVSGSGHGIAVDGEGNLYLGGNVSGTGSFGKVAIEAPTQAAFALKLTPAGEGIWASVIPGSHGALYHEITCDASGRVWGAGMFKGAVAVAGETFASSGEKDNDGLIVHLDSEGRVKWARQLHGNGTDYCLGVATDGKGKVYVCGDFNADTELAGKALTTKGSGDIFLTSFDETGTLRWTQLAGGEKNDSAYPLVFRAPDELIFAGAFSAPAVFGGHELKTSGGSDLYAAKWKLSPAP
ncbi:MAG: hypothetical protein KDN18_02695 [Verrucomicrobiae bacterium]|nr:hypothetical protein [Verrucomicrobiae bacterium]